MPKRSVDIIGAGISGLATAYYLDKACPDAIIRIWEKDKGPGGLASNFETGDFSVEKFYHHMFRRDVALQTLLRELGMGEDIAWKPASTGSYYFSQPYRLSSPADLLKFKPLPPLERFRFGLMMLHCRRIKDWQKLDKINVRDFILQKYGKTVYNVIWEPLLRAKFGPHSNNISMAWLWSKLVDRGGSRNWSGFEYLGYVKGGLGRMFDRLVDVLRKKGHDIHFEMPVERLEIDHKRNIQALWAGGKKIETDVTVCCTQVPDLARLIPPDFQNYKSDLDRIHFLANVSLILILKKSLAKFYWNNVYDSDSPFTGVIEQTNFADPRDFKNKHLVYISSYILEGDKRLNMTSNELFNYYLPYIQKMFPDFSPDNVTDTMIWSAPYAQPIVHVDYLKTIPDIQTPISNLLLCSMAQIYPHDRQVSNAVELAIKTVGKIVEKI